MTEETKFSATVYAPKDRYRRAGIGFKKGDNEVEVTAAQIADIRADRRLKVLETNAPEEDEAEAKSKTPAKKAAAKPKAAAKDNGAGQPQDDAGANA